jgi:vancomycin resistance protein YoaR
MKNKLIFFTALVLTFVPLVALAAPLILNYDKTADNTHLLGRDYSHLSRSQIYQKLAADFPLPSSLKLSTSSSQHDFSLGSISAQIDQTKIANTMLYRRLNQGLLPYIKYFFAPKNFTLDIKYDSAAFDSQLNQLASQIDKPYIPAQFELKDKNITYKPGQLGVKLNRSLFQQQLLSSLSNWQIDQPLTLPLETDGRLPTESQVTQAQSRAQKLIGKTITLQNDISPITLTDQTIISWLDFAGGFQTPLLDEYVQSNSSSLKRDPVNAVFKVENGKVLEFRPALNGLVVNQSEFSRLLGQTLTQLESSSESSLTLNIPMTASAPVVATADVNNLGIKDLLGKGTSTFKHSNAIRNHNITQGASIVNRILVAPGETFSFVKALGDVSLEAGFKKAYIIRAGRTELDVGGGICQVSTTFFRAMLNAGLDIRDRRHHAYRVSYYEEDMPPGYDATVFVPSPDLTFVNDTGHHLLIQNQLDLQNKRLTYEIWGTSDGRQAQIANYRQWGAQPAPPDVWIDDPTLPAGKVVQDEHRIPGLKTSFDWTVTRDGQVIHQKTFTSSYQPWAAVYRRGIGN